LELLFEKGHDNREDFSEAKKEREPGIIDGASEPTTSLDVYGVAYNNGNRTHLKAQ